MNEGNARSTGDLNARDHDEGQISEEAFEKLRSSLQPADDTDEVTVAKHSSHKFLVYYSMYKS